MKKVTNTRIIILHAIAKLEDVILVVLLFLTETSAFSPMCLLECSTGCGRDSSGVSVDARLRIEELFRLVVMGEREPRELKNELDHWGIFEEYEDRFFAIFKKRR